MRFARLDYEIHRERIVGVAQEEVIVFDTRRRLHSRRYHRKIRGKVEGTFEDMGPQSHKTIAGRLRARRTGNTAASEQFTRSAPRQFSLLPDTAGYVIMNGLPLRIRKRIYVSDHDR